MATYRVYPVEVTGHALTSLSPSIVMLDDGRLIDASKPLGRRVFDTRVRRTIERLERQARIDREWASYR